MTRKKGLINAERHARFSTAIYEQIIIRSWHFLTEEEFLVPAKFRSHAVPKSSAVGEESLISIE